MNLPWPSDGAKTQTKDVITFDLHGLTPKDVTRRFYLKEYEPETAVRWNAKMWARVSHALEQYSGHEEKRIVHRLSGITADVARAIEKAPDVEKISIDKTQWVYLCSHVHTIGKAADTLQGSLKTFDDGFTLAAFVQDINQMAQDTGYGADTSLEKLCARSAQIRSFLGHKLS